MSNPVTITGADGAPFVDIERVVDHPVRLVYRAHAEPELLTRWLGPRGYEMELSEYELVSGGRYRYVHRNPAGTEFAFRGTFHTVRPEELIVQTFEYLGAPDQVSLGYLWFVPIEGDRTLLRARDVHPSVEARDAMIASGMEHGVVEGYERLDETLAAL